MFDLNRKVCYTKDMKNLICFSNIVHVSSQKNFIFGMSNKRKITHDIVPIQIVVNTAINKSSVYLLRKNCD